MWRTLTLFLLTLLLITACAQRPDAQDNIALLESPVPQNEAPELGSDVLNTYPITAQALEPGDCVLLGEVTVEAGQNLYYNITFAGKANVQVGLISPGSDSEDPDNPAYFSLSVLGGSHLIGRTEPAAPDAAGSYTLCLRNLGGEAITDVTGTVQTCKENNL